ncbi:MAG: hypothetical protein CMH36_06265 [Microbacterium sp.]|jgi:hypothetical protein|uniref:Uncharacterized protein n=1 Tax=Microbacterium ginsengisoli TaxID=400772 RepID=A0A0F0LUX4_9MICO|nr:hypothetical protein [Microbacterium ginsengisoli]KJL36519.1 hypothetical protein RR49_01529 [Microbacterium ginsengisoli]MAL06416.1 hypothetical protein [Microbacterium sp.]MBN9207154.1 hypothetical protein [Microbacterium ginsengisoli]HAN24056.1 hypothetical protein [Microbacterium ginsengisoli]
MVTLLLDSAQLEIVLSGAERLTAFRKRNIVVERSSITRAQLTDDPWTWLRGTRGRSTYVPGVTAAGTWRTGVGDDFAVIRAKRPGVVIDLDESAEFSRIILTTRHGVALLRALRLDGGDEPTDVAELAPDAG